MKPLAEQGTGQPSPYGADAFLRQANAFLTQTAVNMGGHRFVRLALEAVWRNEVTRRMMTTATGIHPGCDPFLMASPTVVRDATRWVAGVVMGPPKAPVSFMSPLFRINERWPDGTSSGSRFLNRLAWRDDTLWFETAAGDLRLPMLETTEVRNISQVRRLPGTGMFSVDSGMRRPTRSWTIAFRDGAFAYVGQVESVTTANGRRQVDSRAIPKDFPDLASPDEAMMVVVDSAVRFFGIPLDAAPA